jgi:hypothetical protein
MDEVVRIVRISIEQTDSGLFKATSEDLPGLLVTHRDIAAIRTDLPSIIKLVFQRRHNLDVEVREAMSQKCVGAGAPRLVPDWVAIPAHIAAASHGQGQHAH